MDYGKYQYAKAKQERGRKIQKTDLKGVRIGFRTSEHDLKFKAANIDKFLKKGHKVRIELRLRGREKGLRDLARKKLVGFLTVIEEPYKTEQEIRSTPGGGFATLISREK